MNIARQCTLRYIYIRSMLSEPELVIAESKLVLSCLLLTVVLGLKYLTEVIALYCTIDCSEVLDTISGSSKNIL